jgi:putative hemolysin
MKAIRLVILIFLGMIFIAGCTQSTNGSKQPVPGSTPAVTTSSALANPAAVFCEEKSYKYEIRTNPDGSEYGVCIFPNRAECEEWAFYLGTCNESTGK